jgi:hypothetical protein
MMLVIQRFSGWDSHPPGQRFEHRTEALSSRDGSEFVIADRPREGCLNAMAGAFRCRPPSVAVA